MLAKEPDKRPNDWRWIWDAIKPIHYTDCPVFAMLSTVREGDKQGGSRDEIMQLRPGAFGMSVNLKALWKWVSKQRSLTNLLGLKAKQESLATVPQNPVSPDERGLLDYLADAQQGLSTITEISAEIAKRFSKMSPLTIATAEVLQNKSMSFEAKRLKVRKLASQIGGYADWLHESNKTYQQSVTRIEEGFRELIDSGAAAKPEERDGVLRFVEAMNMVRTGAQSARHSFADLIKQLDPLPRLEQEFSRAKRRFAEELGVLVQNVDRFGSVAEATGKAASRFL